VLLVDEDMYQVKLNGSPVPLSARQFKMFNLFYKNPKKVYTRSMLLDIIYPDNLEIQEQSINAVVSRINKAFKKLTGKKVIKSRHGIGYYYELL